MALTLEQISKDLDSQTSRTKQYNSKRNNTGNAEEEPQIISKQTVEKSTLDDLSHDSIVESIDKLVDSVRNIRAMTDEVMDARARIDEILDNAKELKIAVAPQNNN
ncbi:hypothetical protein COEREDRAFT_89772 [Coemansia reversa NRRL 1564]|uniref:Uncharacterized protein n=1 Tax=Coemansia reversa (strain ATCC 12441 / NRRL 1564) TaxID=763665 RepID=A0A2G5B2E7_COERN|nr:hypothetical protein COEREDRAFT_89772 [Coemansia reversa NRRL 1564]|eukprot:PIA13189.1 hypothetical protein COEREDRAFT_89772 [Coemansia reversa NRRL 1564]